jgi:hypothetical protein
MKASVTICRDPFHPGRHRDTRILTRRRKIAALAPRTQQPFICLINGAPLLRAGWQRKLRDGDLVTFILLPQGGGGGGSNPLSTILMMAVMVFAPAVGLSLATSMGVTSTIGIGLVRLGVGIVGSALVNSLLPPPKLPTAASANALAAASPTYSLQAQGNQARIDQPIPVIYGRMRVYPDFAAMPYTEYSGNEQYLYQLLLIGQGEYSIEAIKIEDTAITSFEEITTEVVAPGGSVTLFPANVVTSGLVSGQEALLGSPVGGSTGFVANAAATQANAIGIDIVCPRGLYYAADNGSLNAKTVTWTVEAQAINDIGTATGAWATLGTETLTRATTTPVRQSYRYAVTAGRYQVRLTRTNAKDTSSRAGHELDWAAMRAYLPGSQAYGQCTMLAVRARASNNLSAQSSRKINCVVTRKLPIWSGSTWSANTATRSIAWAFADACRASYGGKLANARVNLAQLLALDTTWTTRGDQFNGSFDSQGTLWEALTTIARAGRAQPYLQGGIVNIVRDQAATLPVAMFTGRNIVKGSFKLTYAMASDQSPDAVEISYFDEDVWSWRSVTGVVSGGTSSNPAKVKSVGITKRAQAWREAMYMAACNRYRRRHGGFTTEMEGFIPSLNDLAAVSHDMPQWGQFGEILGWDVATKTLTLSEPLTWPTGTCYLAFRRRDGSMAGPWSATAGADAYHAIIPGWLSSTDPTPDTGIDRERSHYAFGLGAALYAPVRVLGVKPKSDTQVELSVVVEDDRVHSADATGSAPAAPGWVLPIRNTVPTVTGLTATPMLFNPGTVIITWNPAPGAEHYLIDQSSDGVAWTRCGDTSDTTYTTVALYGAATIIRVCGAGMVRGPWAVLGGVTPTPIGTLPPAALTGLAAEQPFVGTTAAVKWNAMPGADSYTVLIYYGTALLRTVIGVKGLRYAYSFEDAKADGGPYRALTFTVSALSGSSASTASSVTLTNPQCAAPTNLAAVAGVGNIMVSAAPAPETDYLGTRIFMGTTSGFTPDPTSGTGNMIYDGPTTAFLVAGLTSVTTARYFKMTHYDVFGQDSPSYSTASTTPLTNSAGLTTINSVPSGGVLGIAWVADIVYNLYDSNIYEWHTTGTPAYVQAAPLIAGQRIVTGSLSAYSGQIGTITGGTLQLDAGGWIKGGQSAYNTGVGYWVGYDSTMYKQSFANSSGDGYRFDASGMTIVGNLTVTSATESAVSINGAFTALTGWYGDSTSNIAPYSAVWSWDTTAGLNKLKVVAPATLYATDGMYSAKFTVSGGEFYRLSMDWLPANDGNFALDIVLYYSLQTSFAYSAVSPATMTAAGDDPTTQVIPIQTITFSTGSTPPWQTTPGAVGIPAGATFASIGLVVTAL